MAAVDLVALPDVKSMFDIASAKDDDLLKKIITSASAFCNSYTQRNLKEATYTRSRYSGTGSKILVPRESPITALTEIIIDDETVASSKYGYSPDFFYMRDDLFTKGIQNVQVSYKAGYADAVIPEDLKLAVIEIIGIKYRQKNRLEKSSENLMGAGSVVYLTDDLPAHTKLVLDLYKRVHSS